MSQESKVVNVYSLVNHELERMHKLLVYFMEHPSKPPPAGTVSNVQHVYKRIESLQDLMVKHMSTTEEVFQEKVAELALTGDKSETK